MHSNSSVEDDLHHLLDVERIHRRQHEGGVGSHVSFERVQEAADVVQMFDDVASHDHIKRSAQFEVFGIGLDDVEALTAENLNVLDEIVRTGNRFRNTSQPLM